MPYTHFGRIGDVWKHLPLCSVLSQEMPTTYVETNSAFAAYKLSASPEQLYGASYCYDHAHLSPAIGNSQYIALLQEQNSSFRTLQYYLGSPGLALRLLRLTAREFLFFDVEQPPLDDIVSHAHELGIAKKVTTLKMDSIEGTLQIVKRLDQGAFLHIDPYSLFESNARGRTFFDVFMDATSRGLKCFLWYGYLTKNERHEIRGRMIEKLRDAHLLCGPSRLFSAELFMKTILPETVLVNPGIVGCGVLTSNLSPESNNEVRKLATELARIYEGSKVFERYSGELESEVVIG